MSVLLSLRTSGLWGVSSAVVSSEQGADDDDLDTDPPLTPDMTDFDLDAVLVDEHCVSNRPRHGTKAGRRLRLYQQNKAEVHAEAEADAAWTHCGRTAMCTDARWTNVGSTPRHIPFSKGAPPCKQWSVAPPHHLVPQPRRDTTRRSGARNHEHHHQNGVTNRAR